MREREIGFMCILLHIHMYECTVLSFLCTCLYVNIVYKYTL